jgi:hypothetical protein
VFATTSPLLSTHAERQFTGPAKSLLSVSGRTGVISRIPLRHAVYPVGWSGVEKIAAGPQGEASTSAMEFQPQLQRVTSGVPAEKEKFITVHVAFPTNNIGTVMRLFG